MDDNKLLQKLAEKLTLQERYAYCHTIGAFLSYVEDKNVLTGLMSLVELNEQVMNVTLEESFSFFEEGGTILGPLDYLELIDDRTVLNSLMFSCRVITSVACGNIDGEDCKQLAEEHFNDWFHHLGFTDGEIRSVTEQICSFNPIC